MSADAIVTVRMPASLVAALKERLAEDHYADLSEQVRSIVRKGCLRYVRLLPGAPQPPDASAPAASREEQVERLLGDLRKLLAGGEPR